MTWSLIKEAGIDYAAMPDARVDERLCFPTYAARAADGSYVISEERGIHKLVPFRFECRTLRVDVSRNILFDSTSLGIDDGFGCLMGDGSLGLVRRTQWELLIVSSRGQIVDRLGLENLSKRIPRYAAWTAKGTFLVVFFNRSYEVDIVEIDHRGQLLWYLPPGSVSLGIASSVQWLPSDTFLIADSFRHIACEVDRRGNVLWQFGEAENPSSHRQRLSSPSCAKCVAGGQRLIADARNHRILSLSPQREVGEIPLPDSGVSDPTHVDALPDQHVLVCDTGNARVIELDKAGRVVWDYGDAVAARRYLSYPRSVDVIAPDRYLVADTGHNRIVEFVHGEAEPIPFRGDDALFWPRCVRALPRGTLLIADGRNGRIVEVSRGGDVRRELAQIQLEDQLSLHDPHDVRELPNGHLLISDSPQDQVLEVDWSGVVHRVIGGGVENALKDPHSAQQLDDGSIVISDTGNHRVLIVGPDGACIRSIEAVEHGGIMYRLHHPRYAEVSPEGTLVIADTGQNRILGATLIGQFLWEFSRVSGSKLPRLNQPRWATLVGPDEIVVCDHFHHRFVHARRTSDVKADS
jgi:hypothetical protein